MLLRVESHELRLEEMLKGRTMDLGTMALGVVGRPQSQCWGLSHRLSHSPSPLLPSLGARAALRCRKKGLLRVTTGGLEGSAKFIGEKQSPHGIASTSPRPLGRNIWSGLNFFN